MYVDTIHSHQCLTLKLSRSLYWLDICLSVYELLTDVMSSPKLSTMCLVSLIATHNMIYKEKQQNSSQIHTIYMETISNFSFHSLYFTEHCLIGVSFLFSCKFIFAIVKNAPKTNIHWIGLNQLCQTFSIDNKYIEFSYWFGFPVSDCKTI